MEYKETGLAEKTDSFDKEIDKRANNLLKSLGYEIPESMTFSQAQLLNQQMAQNGHKMDVQAEQQGTNYVVEIQLTQTLVFGLEE